MDKKYHCILVIEDSPDIAQLLKTMLDAKGYVVFIAENGKEALTKLDILNDRHRPCLILCDLNMPVMDGWEFIEAVGKVTKVVTIPVVIHSSAENTPDGYDVLKKPAALAELLLTVEKHCGLPEPVAVVVEPIV